MSVACLVCSLCCNECIIGINYSTRHEVFESLRVYVIDVFCIGYILLIVLCDIAHAVFLRLLVCMEPPCDGVEA